MSKYRIGIPCIEGLRLGMTFNSRLNDTSLLAKRGRHIKMTQRLGQFLQTNVHY